jgi:hypothetical protein
MTRVVLLFLLPATLAVMFLWRRREVRRERVALEAAIRDLIVVRIDSREVLKQLLQCDFVETLDGREQRFVTLVTDDFEIYLSKETRRDRCWAKLKRGQEVFEARVGGSSKLGRVIASLFTLVDKRSAEPEAPATETLQEAVAAETAGAA